MEIKVLNKQGSETGRTVTLSESIFGLSPNDHAIYLDVKQFLANQRQGTHKTKERKEIHRSTKKIFRQKGTGGARHGSLKAGIFVGGARIHGPRPRDYSFKLNKKLKQLARKSAFAYKVKENNITVLESFSFDAPKTKQYISLLNNLKLANEKVLMIIPEYNDSIYRSSRNLPKAKVVAAKDVNTYEILHANKVILLENSLPIIVETLN